VAEKVKQIWAADERGLDESENWPLISYLPNLIRTYPRKPAAEKFLPRKANLGT